MQYKVPSSSYTLKFLYWMVTGIFGQMVENAFVSDTVIL